MRGLLPNSISTTSELLRGVIENPTPKTLLFNLSPQLATTFNERGSYPSYRESNNIKFLISIGHLKKEKILIWRASVKVAGSLKSPGQRRLEG